MKDWIELTAKEKREFKKFTKSMESSVPRFFTLESDKHDCGGRFVELTNEQVIKVAKDSAKWLLGE